jgi:hypothetical protein
MSDKRASEIEDNRMDIWNAVCKPPATALKKIEAGRLRGKSDINPQWRYEAMTRLFGPCGAGWKYTIDRLWREEASADQHFAFAQVSVCFRISGDKWSEPIQGVGGSMLVTKESSGLHSSDEGYKMAITDALGTAMKMLGVAADIYAGKWDGSKYADEPKKVAAITEKQLSELVDLLTETNSDKDKFLAHYGIKSIAEITPEKHEEAMGVLKTKLYKQLHDKREKGE